MQHTGTGFGFLKQLITYWKISEPSSRRRLEKQPWENHRESSLLSMLHVRHGRCENPSLRVISNHLTNTYGSLQQGKKALEGLILAFKCSSQKIMYNFHPHFLEIISSYKHREEKQI